MTKNCVIVATHLLDKYKLKYLRYLQDECKDIMDFYVIYNGKKEDLSMLDGINYIYIESNEVMFFMNDKGLSNAFSVIFEFSHKHKYDHYLFLEYDLVYNGKFRSFIEKLNSLDNENYDLIHIENDAVGGPLNHWPKKYIKNNPFDKLYFSWIFLFYISYDLLNSIESFEKNENNTIFYEFLLTTFAYNTNKYKVTTFESLGYNVKCSYGPSKNYEIDYVIRNRPNTFYHPIKNQKIIRYE